jgi:capsular polysaccharide biosynthesis protein
LRRLLVVLRRRILILAVTVVAGLVAAYLGSSRAAVYQTRSTLYVGQSATDLKPTTEYAQAVLAATFVQIVPTPTIVGQAIAEAHISRKVTDVVKATKASVAPGSNLIRITVQDRDPVMAKDLADSIATVFVADSRTLAPLTASATGLSPNKAPASIAQAATVPSAPLDTGLHRNLALGGVAGLLLGIALVLLLDFLGLSARTPRELEAQTGMPLIGVVPLQPQLQQAGPRGPSGRPGDNLLLVADDA